MAGEYNLKNGLQTDWILHDNTWKAGVDQNWKTIDWRMAPSVLSIHPTSATLPPTPAHGDAFLVENVNQVWIWNAQTVQFDKVNLVNAFLFFNDAEGKFKKWIASVISDLEAGVGGAVPIGGAIPFEDYGILPLPPGFWWCDGSVIVAPGSPINGQVARDMSGRYPIGYGTPGGNDMPGAAYNPGTVGNLNHEINLQHNHSMSGATIAGLLDTADGLTAAINTGTISNDDSSIAGDTYYVRDDDGVSKDTHHFAIDAGVNDEEGQHIHDMPALDHDHNVTGSGSANTGNDLSLTQNIQPDSGQWKWILRVL